MTKSASTSVSIEPRDHIALIWIDNPPVNVLSHHVRQGIFDAVAQIEADDNFTAAILLCRGRTFIAGADIKEFDQPAEPPLVTQIADAMEASKKLWVAAIHGTSLGGGLETALGCHYRIVDKNARLGFPEVNLGVIPGAGGTVRLPRLIGYEMAVDMVTSGTPINAQAALQSGLADALSENDLLDDALAFTQNALTQSLPTPCGHRPNPPLPPADFWETKQKSLARRRSDAPLVALDIMQKSHGFDFAEAMKLERKSFVTLRESDQSAALRYVFFAERSTLRPIKDEALQDITQTGIVGGGLMGCGIATAILQSGLACVLIEQDSTAADKAKEKILGLLEQSLKRKKISAAVHAQAVKNLRTDTQISALTQCDLVIEAIYEDFDAKKELINTLDSTLPAQTIIASNTSYLDMNALADGLAEPQRFMGLHFFSPAQIMKLVEIINTDQTQTAHLHRAFNFCLKLRKMPIRAGICEGFIGNRLLKIYRQQAEALLLKGYTPDLIDEALRQFGMPLGVFEVQDMTGLDIAWAGRKEARAEGREISAPIADALCEQGHFGKKTASGWYDYADDGTRRPSQKVRDLITAQSGADAQTAAPDEAVLRTDIFAPMHAEAEKILAENIAERAEDIDIVMIHGYGFPRWRGGLMYYCQKT